MDRADEELKVNMNLLEQWIDDITNYQQLSVKTQRTYISDVRNAARIFAKNGIAFTAIRKEHLKIFLSTIKKETKVFRTCSTPEILKPIHSKSLRFRFRVSFGFFFGTGTTMSSSMIDSSSLNSFSKVYISRTILDQWRQR